MKDIFTKFANLNLIYRCTAYWIAALTVGLIFASTVPIDVLVLFLILFVPITSVATFALIILGAMSSWRVRGTGVHAIGPAAAPFAAIAIGAFVFFMIWSIRGVSPLQSAGTSDFQIDQTSLAPDGALRAIVLEDLSGGPATGVSQDVYIDRGSASSTSFFRYRDLVFTKECIKNLTVQWTGSRTLSISFSEGYDGLHDDGVVRPPVWVFPAIAYQVTIVIVRRLIQQRSLC